MGSPYFLNNLYGGGHPVGAHLVNPDGSPRDCAECHSPGKKGVAPSDWVQFIDLSTTLHGSSGSTSCNACHGGGMTWSRSAFWKPKVPPSIANSGGHPESSLLSKKGITDCTSCHSNAGSVNKNSWHAATLKDSFHKYPNPSVLTSLSCNECHSGSLVQFNRLGFWSAYHPSVNTSTTDCNSCHSTKTVNIVGDPTIIVSEWRGTVYAGGYNHSEPPAISSCASCHDNNGNPGAGQRPTVAPKLNSKWTTIDPAHFKASNPSDCKSCHTTPPMNMADASLNTWNVQKDGTGTVLSYNHQMDNAGVKGPITVACGTCHTGPTNLVVSIKNAANMAADLTVGHSAAKTCDSCHTVGATWRPSNHPTVGSKKCLDCHTDQMPAGKSLLNGAIHISNLGASDCNTCHSSQTNWALATSGAPSTITVGGFGGVATLTLPHPLMTNCNQCHAGGTGAGKPANDYDHSPRPPSCNACHEKGTPFIAQPTLHSRTAPPATLIVSGYSVSAPGHFGATDCEKCHNSDSFKGWKKRDHEKNLNGTNTCNTCHGPIPK